MTKPAGVVSKTKDNSRKKHREHAEWMAAKKIGRPKQIRIEGRWEKA